MRLILALLLLAVPLRAQEAQHRLLAERFRGELEAISRATPGVVGIQVVDLTSGAEYGVNAELVFPTASAIKVPLLVELLRQGEAGRIRMDERVELRAGDRAGGSGVLQFLGDGTSALAMRDLAVLMVVLSDNTATNLLIERVGMDAVNRTLAGMGFTATRLQRRMMRPLEGARGQENVASPAEAARLMARVARCELPVSAAGCAEVQRILRIAKEGSYVAPLPAATAVAWKGGDLGGVRTAWGWVALERRPYVAAIMVNFSDDAAAEEAVRRASAAAHAFFARLAGTTPFGVRASPEVLRAATPRP